MVKIDIISGFLGAGKTTLIKRLLQTRLNQENIVLIENEFGEIGIDSGFLSETKIDIKELNQGCICCSLQGDFATALKEVIDLYKPERVIIEPSGVGKLSDIVKAVIDSKIDATLNALVCVCDANKAKMYLKNFGEFYIDQVKNAKTIFLSRADVASEEKIEECIAIVRANNENASIVTTSIDKLSDEVLLSSYEATDIDFVSSVYDEMMNHDHECCCGHDHHEHHDHECCCGHDHHEHHDHECCCGHDHHEHHDHECCCGHDHHEHHDHECCCEHDHHEHHDHECCCGHDHHEHHDHECSCGHDHKADEVFTSVGIETAKKFTKEEIENKLNHLSTDDNYGTILRAKGIVDGADGWLHFDLVPGEISVRNGDSLSIGKICVIGSSLDEDAIKSLFLK